MNHVGKQWRNGHHCSMVAMSTLKPVLLGNAFPCCDVVAGANIALELVIIEHTLAELIHRLFMPAQPAANVVVVDDIVKSVHTPIRKNAHPGASPPPNHEALRT